MLVSMSEVKEDELYQALAEALRKRFGHENSVASLMPGNSRPRNSQLAKMATLGRARRANTMNGGDKVKAPVGEHPRVMALREAERSNRGAPVMFKQGSAELTEKHRRILQRTAMEIGGKPQKIEIRGHTSTKPLPPGSLYKSHWELAYARSEKVMEFLVKLGIDPRRIRLAVAADNEPIHIGNNPLLLEQNPRVEVFILDELIQDLEGTTEEKKQRYSNEGAP